MASLFVTRNDATRQRAVSNGGLGGFVTIGSIRVMETNQGDGKATWPKNRRRKKDRPAPISIIQGSDKFFIKQEVLSPTPIADESLPQSPRTPVSRYNPLLKSASVSNNHLPPPPPPHTKQQCLPAALELPGSLLLPSQGFPQSDPPCTPSRTLPCLSRSSSEESDQIWTPAISISSATDIEDDEMPRPFPPMHLPRAAKPSKLRDHEASATQELGIGKPISSMSAEELLSELPRLDAGVVKSVWVPAMIRQHDRIKKLLQDAADVRFDANIGIQDFDQVRLVYLFDPAMLTFPRRHSNPSRDMLTGYPITTIKQSSLRNPLLNVMQKHAVSVLRLHRTIYKLRLARLTTIKRFYARKMTQYSSSATLSTI